jgi:hypothetical protein
MLRAYRPDKFKTPGAHAPVISGDNNKVVIIDAAEREKLVALRQEALEAMKSQDQRRQMAHLPGSGNSPGSVQ